MEKKKRNSVLEFQVVNIIIRSKGNKIYYHNVI